jgi:hypothetical protein
MMHNKAVLEYRYIILLLLLKNTKDEKRKRGMQFFILLLQHLLVLHTYTHIKGFFRLYIMHVTLYCFVYIMMIIIVSFWFEKFLFFIFVFLYGCENMKSNVKIWILIFLPSAETKLRSLKSSRWTRAFNSIISIHRDTFVSHEFD